MKYRSLFLGSGAGLLAVALAQAPSSADKQFLMTAAKADMTEAQRRADGAEPRRVGPEIAREMLEHDHAQNFQQPKRSPRS